MSELAYALVEQAEERVLKRLAERLKPHLEEMTTARAVPSDANWMESSDAAAYLGMSRAALHKRTARGEIPFEQDGPGCKLYFKRSELDAWRCGRWQR